MIEIGPNLLQALLAVVAFATAFLAAWRAERALIAHENLEKVVHQNDSRINVIDRETFAARQASQNIGSTKQASEQYGQES